MVYCLRHGLRRRKLTVLMWLALTIYIWATIHHSTTDVLSRIPLSFYRINNIPQAIRNRPALSHILVHSTTESREKNGSSVTGSSVTGSSVNGSIITGSNATVNVLESVVNKLNDYYLDPIINGQYQEGEFPRNIVGSTSTTLDTRTTINNDNKHRSTESPSINTRLKLAYDKKWVGFPDMDGKYCHQALFSNVTNDIFPQKIKRVKGYQHTANTSQCEEFRDVYGYHRYPDVSQEELNFPIAFIILFHNNFDQIMFLLRAIYHPHNVYCLSVDSKNDVHFITNIKNVISCLPNVFVASKLEAIVYAGFSRLMADIHCMEDLLQHPVQWKYVINMPGQQFPLRTNLELVKILSMLNGTNDIEGMPANSSIPRRYLYKHIAHMDNTTGVVKMVATRDRNPPPPHNIKMVKGSTYGSFSRGFVQFALHDPVARNFLEYSKDFLSPDEYFWSTLQYSRVVSVPGRSTGDPDGNNYITSYTLWTGSNSVRCATRRFVHGICVFTPEDLSNLAKQDALFANKFYIYFHPATLHCLDEWLFNRTVAGLVRDLSVYKHS